MLVMAKCTARAWDSDTAREYFAGVEYEIDSDSKLAELTVVPVAYENGKPVRYVRDNDGKIKAIPVPKPAYVFEFDRNATRTDQGVMVVKDYSCKKCGKDCKTLPNLGRHTRMAHRNEVAQEQAEAEITA